MNYKTSNLLDGQPYILINSLDGFDEPEIEEQSAKIYILLKKLLIDSSPNNINSTLKEIYELGGKCNFSDDKDYIKFENQDILDFICNYIFNDHINSTEIESENIQLIFQILTFLFKMQSFSNSIGLYFIKSFFQNYYKYDLNCQNLGIISVSQIILNINNERDLDFLDIELINFLISLFPKEDFLFHQILDSLSFLYITIFQKIPNIDIEYFQQIADALSSHISRLQEQNEAREYLKGSISFFHNYAKFMLLYLEHNPPIGHYLREYFKFFNICYNYCINDSEARNDIYHIYTILIERSNSSSNKNITHFLINSIPSESYIHDIEMEPDRRVSIFKLFLAAANKDFEFGQPTLGYFSKTTTLLEIILKIQVENDGFSFECLKAIYKLLDKIVIDVINTHMKMKEISTQIMIILLKMLNEEDSEFLVQVLNSIDNLCRNICNRYGLDMVKDILNRSDDFEILIELSDEYDEAKAILANIEYQSQE